MTLDEAIQYYQEVAKEKCDDKYKQLVEWLRELQWRRKDINSTTTLDELMSFLEKRVNDGKR